MLDHLVPLLALALGCGLWAWLQLHGRSEEGGCSHCGGVGECVADPGSGESAPQGCDGTGRSS